MTTETDALQQRLLSWAAWLTSGGSSVGYPTKSVLHESWLPPTAGATPTMVVAPASSNAPHRELHAIIEALSLKLQNTLVVVYLMRAKPAEQVALLECQASTVRARVTEAKRLIGMALNGRALGGSAPR